MVNPAHYTCSQLLDAIKSSQVDFLLQETPQSVFLTMRKKNIKNFKPASKDELFENVIENLKQENDNLRNVVKEITIENQANKNEIIILEKRLEKAEEDMLKHFEKEKNQKSKPTDEICKWNFYTSVVNVWDILCFI